MEVILSIDIGTSSVKCLALTHTGTVLSCTSVPYPSLSIVPGWVEQHPEDWWKATTTAVANCLEKSNHPAISGIALSGHMSGLVLLDQDGNVLRPCITIADTRSSTQSKWMHDEVGSDVCEITGNSVIDAFVAPKLLWVKEQEYNVFKKVKCFLMPKDYIRYRLTGRLGTDHTDAGNTLLYDPRNMDWALDVVKAIGIPPSMLPELYNSTDIFGGVSENAAKHLGVPAGIPVVTGAADMACNALGTGLVRPGTVVMTIGTSGQVLTMVDAMERRGYGRITIHPHVIPGSFYAMGSHFSGGLSTNWIASQLSGDSHLDYKFLQLLAMEAENISPGSNGTTFIPYLVGSGTPHFNANDKAAFVGVSLTTNRGALFRSVMEGVSYDMRHSLEVFRELGLPIESIHVAGGGLKMEVWQSILSNVLGKTIRLLQNPDTSTIGAGLIGGVGIGWYKDITTAVEQILILQKEIEPNKEDSIHYQYRYERFNKLVLALREFF